MTRRWIRLLVGTFPGALRTPRATEMIEALELEAPRGRRLAKESLALLWASAVAWRRHLRSTAGLAGAALLGASLWFGVVLGIGPALRVRLIAQHGPGDLGWEKNWVAALVALAFFVGAVALVRRSRSAAFTIGAVAVLAAGASTTLGDWMLLDSLVYEARWSGLALAMVAATTHFAPEARSRRLVAVPVVVVAASTAALPWPAWTWFSTRNYGRMLEWELFDRAASWTATNDLIQALVLAGAVAIVVAMFTQPWVAIIVAPAALHLAVADPVVGLSLVGLVAAALVFDYVRRSLALNLRVRRRSDRPAASCAPPPDR